jgi:hypothetical protein
MMFNNLIVPKVALAKNHGLGLGQKDCRTCPADVTNTLITIFIEKQSSRLATFSFLKSNTTLCVPSF